MITVPHPIITTACQVRRVRWSLATTPCDRCRQPAARVWEVTRTAIDIDLDQPVLLAVVVSVHRCRSCQHYFRAQPGFLRPDAIYSNRVVQKAVEAVYQDGMAMRCVPARLARDFWVQPSEAMVRRWCGAYAAGLDFDGDYLPWVVETFSGVLAVDELYQGRLALLLAVDPAAPEGDRLVGYQLVHGSVEQTAVTAFLRRLQAAGVMPEHVVTDGSALYPSVLATVWPTAVHQLCLFHETRRVTAAVAAVAKALRTLLPKPPAVNPPDLRGRRRTITPPADAIDDATERWRGREATRASGIAQVHALRQRGRSLRAIAQETGFNRRTVMRWLREEPPIVAGTGLPEAPILPAGSVSGPDVPPPAPWTSWDEVRQVRATVKAARPLLLRRPEHLTPEDQAQGAALLASPIGADLQLARAFLEEWSGIWRDAAGQRRSPAAAQGRHERWHAQPTYRRLVPLRRAQAAITPARFAQLSPFLREAGWEATSNGAERMGRTFRHRQAPHVNLRSAASIAAALTVRACLQQAQVTHPVLLLPNACRRGRRRVVEPVLRAAA